MAQAKRIMLLVAAGRGVRAGGDLPKQYRRIGRDPVLTLTLRAILEPPIIDAALVVIHPDDRQLYDAAVARLPPALSARLSPPVDGGATRSRSVMAGLAAIAAQDGALIGIHDAARPFVPADVIARAFAAAEAHGAALPVLPVTDTIKLVADAAVTGTPERAALRAAQTPQVFRLADIRAAYDLAAARGDADASDDAAMIERAGGRVTVVDGDERNIKLTTTRDFEMAEMRLARAMSTRVGTGYDVHAFGAGDHVTLCGVAIPHDRGVLAHSDGDVAYHALCDAIFGALAEGDIGRHFPPSDMRWKGAASGAFLRFAVERVIARGGRLVHVDVSIICEEPRIGPHREAMLARLAADTGLPVSRIGLKATTSEKLGFTGRREGLAALATATLELPDDADA
jgi:2-C-methyl-D-erythritol 4-phosphate cytidylyltransferase/2-C-methyl-D-erythritol 2,4-cyclodiphosphate synthase